ncbi:hypothetical protein TSUD_181690 [Trifolium subterraneum]|uniref:Transposase MuDR plant domain-containing protein n=1 Tax=Trifolium subterraneum TaxID=3900 RepID=A0A2Z6NU61_TRISU|nr:hypothetical protein TSUD_181690 [Trifolium subterraneum]
MCFDFPDYVALIEPEANTFEAQSNVNHEAQFEAQSNVEHEAQFEAQSNVNHEAQFEAQSNVEHEAQFEAQSNVDELDSDEGDSSVVSLDYSDDEHILDGEIFIDEVVHEVVHSEPKKKSKNKGGRPKKHIVTDPKGKGTVWSNNDIEESDHELSDDMSLNIVKKRKRTKTVLEESDHDSSELDTENDESDDGTKVHYPPFVIPKKMEGYKWVKGTTFSTREEFKEAISTYAVTNNRDLRYIKNDNERVRVGCKDGCPFVALLSKVPGEDTWQLRTLNDEHKCMPEYRVKRLNANWLGIPCCHAVTCIREGIEDPESYIPNIYRKEAYVQCYEPIIYPTYGQNQWEVTNYHDILPPPHKKMPGRPKKSRNKDANEKCRDPTLVSRKGRSNKCGICKQPGHKKATCKQKNGIASGTATQTASGTATQAASATQTAFVSQTGSGTASGNATQTASATQTDSASQTKTGTASKTQTATASKRSKTQVGTTSKPKTESWHFKPWNKIKDAN